MKLIQANGVPESLARVDEPAEPPVRVALVQHHWVEDHDELVASLREGIRLAADAGARIVFLPELTLSRYPADTLKPGDVLITPKGSKGTWRITETIVKFFAIHER